jgi:tetratricopeptide (TPR) repeat protein
MDSLRALRIHNTDSIAAVRKYHNSKKYKRSVAKARAAKAKAQKEGKLNPIAGQSMSHTDSIRFALKHKMDSLAQVRKYKSSKRYTDSVKIARREHSDSVLEYRQHINDSITALRKHRMDSATASRKHFADSIKIVRTKRLDSIKLVRKNKTDSLTKSKADKERLAKSKDKKKQDDLKLKLEIKFKKKREAWTNKTMLKKPWSPQRRLFQNAFTHYNYYYNANRKMEEALANMQRSKKENYDSLLNLYPFDPNRDSAKLKGDMDTIIRKTSVGLQIHDPRVKWANDMYLLMGEAYYYKGNYENAATAFKYVITRDAEASKKNHTSGKSKEAPSIMEQQRHSKLAFLKHKSVHNDAILWLGRTYTSWHRPEDAESVISLCESDPHFPDELQGRLAMEKAFATLAKEDKKAAIEQLKTAADDQHIPGWLRLRAAYICGQLQQENGAYGAAVVSFKHVLDFYPKMEMDFYTRKNIAFNSLLAGEDAASAMKPLKKILRDPKYSSYYDQVYFVMGRLAIKAGKTDEGIAYLHKSISTPKATKKQKAWSFVTMGEAYYSQSKYVNAKTCFDSASKYIASANLKDTALLASIQRRKGLGDVVTPLNIIHEQDSLLELGEESKKEQLAAVKRFLKVLQKQREDSIANAVAAVTPTIALADQPTENSELADWYFNNPTQMTSGSSEFKRKWGNRPLTDNWRRASAQSFVAANLTSELEETAQSTTENNLAGLPSEASLLAKIPTTPEKRATSINIEQKAYIALAKAYFIELEDAENALSTLDILDKKYPDHNQKEEELYLKYQIAIKQNQLDKAQTYADAILKDFPKSKYSSLLKPKQERNDALSNGGIPVSKYYEETYNLLLTHQYADARIHAETGKREYENQLYKKRFTLAEAMANAGSGYRDKADSIISQYIHQYPPTDTLTFWALSIKDYLNSLRKTTGVPTVLPEDKDKKTVSVPHDKPSAPDSSKKTTDSLHLALPPNAPGLGIPASYQFHPEEEHYCLISLPGMDNRINNLKTKLFKADSLKKPMSRKEITTEVFATNRTVAIIKKFGNADSAKTYLNAISPETFSDFAKSEFNLLIISSTNYSKLLADKNLFIYQNFYNINYKK